MDPFSQTLDRLWEVLEGHTGIGKLVRVGNRDRTPNQAQVKLAPADAMGTVGPKFPGAAVEIRPAGGDPPKLFASSDESAFSQRFSIGLTGEGDDPRLSVLPVKFFVYAAFISYLKTHGTKLGLPDFVSKVSFSDVTDDWGVGASAEDQRPRWRSLLTVIVDYRMPTAEVISAGA